MRAHSFLHRSLGSLRPCGLPFARDDRQEGRFSRMIVGTVRFVKNEIGRGRDLSRPYRIDDRQVLSEGRHSSDLRVFGREGGLRSLLFTLFRRFTAGERPPIPPDSLSVRGLAIR